MGKTVTTYLIDGDPKGTQYAFISNKICQMFVVPRSNLAYLNEQEKLQKPAFYILIGEDEATKPQAYIGETENFKERVKDHDSKKTFWQKALIFVSKDADMTKADVQYLEHKAIAEARPDMPIVLYNVPGRTGVNMTAETTLRVARDFKNVIAVKEASGNITQMDDIIKNKPDSFDVISGDDGITFPLITLGAVGVISVIGNAFPREFSRMVRLALQGDYANALAIHHKFAELFKLLFVDGNPAGVKAMLNAMGMVENKLRLPLVPTRITTFEAMRKILNELNIKC